MIHFIDISKQKPINRPGGGTCAFLVAFALTLSGWIAFLILLLMNQ